MFQFTTVGTVKYPCAFVPVRLSAMFGPYATQLAEGPGQIAAVGGGGRVGTNLKSRFGCIHRPGGHGVIGGNGSLGASLEGPNKRQR